MMSSIVAVTETS